WINRNRILLNHESHLFTVPVRQISSFRKINETELDCARYLSWRKKFLKTIDHAYRNAPYFEQTRRILKDILFDDTRYIRDLAASSILAVCRYLGLERHMVLTAQVYTNSHLTSADRVIDICRREDAAVYVNPKGGENLYSQEVFESNGI